MVRNWFHQKCWDVDHFDWFGIINVFKIQAFGQGHFHVS